MFNKGELRKEKKVLSNRDEKRKQDGQEIMFPTKIRDNTSRGFAAKDRPTEESSQNVNQPRAAQRKWAVFS